jgi:membrane protein
VIIFLVWLWLTNTALLFGAVLDAEIERARELQAGIPAERHIRLPVRDRRASLKEADAQARDHRRGRELRQDPPRSSDDRST